MRGTLRTALVAVAAAAALTACSAAGEDEDAPVSNQSEATTPASTQDGDEVEVTMFDAGNAQVGTVWLDEEDGGVEIEVAVSDLEPGFHGFHLHTVGECEVDSADPNDPAKTGDFLSAGGHLGSDAADHGEHAGDLPSLLVDSTGAARLTVRTDALTLADLQDEDGTAVMIHSGRDNAANVPERYAPEGPDEDTLKTGDAGDRIACGVISGG